MFRRELLWRLMNDVDVDDSRRGIDTSTATRDDRDTCWSACSYVTSTSGGQQELAEGKNCRRERKPQRHVDVLDNQPTKAVCSLTKK